MILSVGVEWGVSCCSSRLLIELPAGNEPGQSIWSSGLWDSRGEFLSHWDKWSAELHSSHYQCLVQPASDVQLHWKFMHLNRSMLILHTGTWLSYPHVLHEVLVTSWSWKHRSVITIKKMDTIKVYQTLNKNKVNHWQLSMYCTMAVSTRRSGCWHPF